MVEIDMEDADSHPIRDGDVDMNDDNGDGAEEPPPRLLITKMVSYDVIIFF